MTFDISDFEVRHVPQTDALLDQKQSSLEGIERLVFEMLGRGELPFLTRWVGDERSEDLRPFLGTGRLQEQAQEYLRREVTDKRIGDLLCSLGSTPAREKGSRGWVLPLLNEARSAWDAVKFKVDWDDASRWTIVAHAPPELDSTFQWLRQSMADVLVDPVPCFAGSRVAGLPQKIVLRLGLLSTLLLLAFYPTIRHPFLSEDLLRAPLYASCSPGAQESIGDV